jgi:integrase
MGAGWRNNLKMGEDGYWHHRFRLRGILYEGSTGCPLWKDARDWLNAYKGRISKGEVGLKQAPTLKTAYLHWVQTKTGKVSASHLKRASQAIELHILPHIGQRPADQVSTEDVELLISYYLEHPGKRIMGATKRTKAGANTVLLYLRAIYHHLIKQGFLASIPWKVSPMRVQEPVRSYVPMGLEPQFFAEVDRWRNVPVMLAVRCQFWMGLRESESLSLRWEWFSYDLRRYTPGATKGKEAASLPTEDGIRALLWAILWEHHNGTKPLAGLVLRIQHKPQFTKKAIARAGIAIGIRGLTPHSMRRSYATNLAAHGLSAHHIMKALRHKQLSTSERYVQVAQADLSDALQVLKKSRG